MKKDWAYLLENYYTNSPHMVLHEKNRYAKLLDRFQRKVAAIMEAEANRVRAAVPRLKMKPYAVASGFRVETRLLCSAPGVPKTVVHHLHPEGVLAAIIGCLLNPSENCGSFLMSDARTVLREELEKELGPQLKKAIAAALAGGVDDSKAQQTVQANRERAEGSKRQAALVRLSECMEGYDYNQSDVLEAWSMSQVKRVQSS